MGRNLLFAILIGLSAAAYPQAPSFAQTASRMFYGVLAIKTVSTQCAPLGIDVNVVESILRPHLLANDPKAALIVFSDRGAAGQLQAQTTTTNMNGTGSYDGTFYDAQTGQVLAWTGTYSLAVAPATVQSTTTFVKLIGTISNFGNIAGCTLTFAGGYLQPAQ